MSIDNFKLKRQSTYAAISTELALLSDVQLTNLLHQDKVYDYSIGGKTTSIKLDGTQIFVKKIPLTDIECLPENKMSTANLFNLPPYFQYGIGLDSMGSAGFGAWRELAAHIMTTNWVISGECSNFPLMYHWRLMPKSSQELSASAKSENIERIVACWGDSSAILARFKAKQNASTDIVLFLEHFPATLQNFLSAASNFEMVERDLKGVTSFMNSHRFLHFDAHFRNILTDGERLYFTDFGLAISDRFELSGEEIKFLERHRDYDRALMANSLVNSAIPATIKDKVRHAIVQDYATGTGSMNFSPAVTSILNRYAPIALLMKNFNRAFMTQPKSTIYPADEIAKACAAAGLFF